jgi:hypothetical protein
MYRFRCEFAFNREYTTKSYYHDVLLDPIW